MLSTACAHAEQPCCACIEGRESEAVDWRQVPLEWSARVDSSNGCSADSQAATTKDPNQLLNHPANMECA